VPSASTSSASPSVPAEPAGDVWIVLQTVYTQSECGKYRQGVDVLIETRLQGAAKSERRHAFCPPGVKDMFGACKAFQRCKVAATDAGETDKAVVQCDREPVILQVDETGTRLTGAKLDLLISPSRLRVTPTKSTDRIALVDCP
jgi:hypothetical protein